MPTDARQYQIMSIPHDANWYQTGLTDTINTDGTDYQNHRHHSRNSFVCRSVMET